MVTPQNFQNKFALGIIPLIVVLVFIFNIPAVFEYFNRDLNIGQTGNQQPAIQFAQGEQYLFPRDIKQIRQGEDSLLVLSTGGAVYARGDNDYGQLGVGSFGGDHPELQRVQFPGAAKIRQIDMVQNHALALTETGDVYAWGLNISGQVGDGTNRDANKPVKVMSGAMAVATGYRFSAALDQGGKLWAWGMHCDQSVSALAQLEEDFEQDVSVGGSYYDGDEKSDNYDNCLAEYRLPIHSLKPRLFGGDNRFERVAAGYGHILLLDAAGSAWSVGCNTWGQLGRLSDNKQDYRSVAKIAVPGGHKITQIAAGFRHSAAVDDAGQLWTWGDRAAGNQLNDPANMTLVREALPQGSQPVILAAGYDITSYTDTTGTVYAIGRNTNARITPEKDAESFIKDFTASAHDATGINPGRSSILYWHGRAGVMVLQ